jgi:Na+/proline symporter
MDQSKLGLWDKIPGLTGLDWAIILGYVVMALTIGLLINKIGTKNKSTSGNEGKDYFTAGGTMTWFWVGTSIVATTFAADTPLVLTGWIANGGISQNWLWWGGVIGTVVMTVFFARKWRNVAEGPKGAVTDAELVEMRYGKGPATVLRTIKALFSSLVVNCVVLGWVFAAVIKIIKPVINWETILGSSFYKTLEALYPAGMLFKDDFNTTLTILVLVFFMLIYITKGGLKAVIVVDVILFCVAMTSAVLIAYFTVTSAGGLTAVWDKLDAIYPSATATSAAASNVAGTAYLSATQFKSFIPEFGVASTLGMTFSAFLLTLGVLWWMTGAVDGSGYTAQRFFSAKTPADAEKGALWYTWANFILRTWPWVIAGIAALVLYPRPEVDKIARAATECVNNRATCMQVSQAHFPQAPTVEGKPVYEYCIDNPRTCPIKGYTLLEPAMGHLQLDGLLNVVTDPTQRAQIKATTPEVKIFREDREISYPLMIRDFLPLGFMGLAFATLIGAFMSTVSTQINWGASYLTSDLYVRLVNPSATPARMKFVGRLSTVLLTIIAVLVAATIDAIGDMWIFWMGMMSGLGVPHLLRWLWWRANAWTELSGLGVGLVLSVVQYAWGKSGNTGSFLLQLFSDDPSFIKQDAWHLTCVGLIAAVIAIIVTKMTPPAPESDLREFARTVTPMGFWKDLAPNSGTERKLGETVVYWLLGTLSIYTGMFGLGFLLRAEPIKAVALIAVSAVTMVLLLKGMGRIDRHQKGLKAEADAAAAK